MLSPLTYRFGFCAFGLNAIPSNALTFLLTGEKAWDQHCFGGFILLTHPETPLVVHQAEHCTIIIVGHLFPASSGSPVGEAVENLSRAAHCNDLTALSDLSGRFAIFLVSKDSVIVANDAFGSRSVFYSTLKPTAIASHSHLLATILDAAPNIDMHRLIKCDEYLRRNVKYLPGDSTLYNGIFSLSPNNAIKLGEVSPFRYWPANNRRETSLDSFYRELGSHFEALSAFLITNYNRPLLGITGGIDSRAICCALSHFSVTYEGVTWLGGYTKDSERPIIDQTIQGLGIRHHFLEMDLSNKIFYNEIRQAAKVNSGSFRGRSVLTAAMARAFGSDSTCCFVRGYGAEIIRGFYNLGKSPLRSLSPDEMARGYGLLSEDSEEYKFLVVTAFKGFCTRANLTTNPYIEEFDPNDIFYWEHRMGNWGATMLSEMDAAVHSIVGLNSRRLYECAFGLSKSDRLTKKIFADYVVNLFPRFSGMKVS